MNLTGRIRNTHHLSGQLAQRIPNGRPQTCAWVFMNRPYEIQHIRPMTLLGSGGALTTIDTTSTGYTPTGTAPTIRIWMLQNARSGQFKSIPKKFSDGREHGFLVYTRWKRSDILNHNALQVYISHAEANTVSEWKKVLDIYIRHWICVKWSTHTHQG